MNWRAWLKRDWRHLRLVDWTSRLIRQKKANFPVSGQLFAKLSARPVCPPELLAPPLESVPTLLDGTLTYRVKYIVLKKSVYSVPGE